MSKFGSMLRAVGLLFAVLFGVSLMAGEAPSALVRPAAAFSCNFPARFHVIPSNGEVAPRNARVVVVAAPGRGMSGWEPQHPPPIALHADADGGAEVPSAVEKTAAGNLTTIVLSPRALLEANHAYSVSVGQDAISHFSTNTEIDHEPPRWDGVNEIETSSCYYPLNCFQSGSASFLPASPVDPGHPASQISYAFFTGRAKTPFLYQRAYPSGALALTRGGPCAFSDADWSADPFDVTIRAVDAAGNFSEPHRYRIDLDVEGVSHPREPPWTLIAVAAAAAAVLLPLAAYARHRYRRARAWREAER